jgi:hypothetical protein
MPISKTLKGRFKPQVLQFNITKKNSKGNNSTFTVRAVFEGNITYNIKDVSPYPDENRYGGEITLNLKTDEIDIWRIDEE